MKLEYWLKTILKKYKLLLNYASSFYNTIMLNSKKIKSKNNFINYSGSFFKKCNIQIIGNNNRVIIKKYLSLTKWR